MTRITAIATALITLSLHGKAQMYGNSSMFAGAYAELTGKAEEYYYKGDYRRSAESYAAAFASTGNKARVDDRYAAACAWSMAGVPDSAFVQLQMLTNARYSSYNHLVIDPDLDPVHSDPRWNDVCERIRQNRDRWAAGTDRTLMAILDTIFRDDQQYRMRLALTERKYGRNSPEMSALWNTIHDKDSINEAKVTAIIDKYGWPSAEQAGAEENNAMFLVIQHAGTATQERYLPALRDAVKNGRLAAASLALLEDRVALARGRKQLYGSQVATDASGNYYVEPLEDPDNVDKRRASVGLPPLAGYVKQWGITWDAAQYKKDHP